MQTPNTHKLTNQLIEPTFANIPDGMMTMSVDEAADKVSIVMNPPLKTESSQFKSDSSRSTVEKNIKDTSEIFDGESSPPLQGFGDY